MIKKILAGALMALMAISGFAADIVKGDNGLFGLMVTEKGQSKWIVKPKYVNMHRNSTDGSYFVYGNNRKWGLISANGTEIVPCKYNKIAEVNEVYQHSYNPNATKQYASFTLTRDYGPYIREYVEKKVNAWQKKNEFENSEEYMARVNEANRNEVIHQAVAEVCEECIMKIQDKKLDMSILDYDADHETYLVETPLGNLIVPVSRQNAQIFKQVFPQIATENTYDIVGGKVVVRSVVFSYNNKTLATFSDRERGLYSQADVSYEFEPIDIPVYAAKQTGYNIAGKKGNSDVDTNIPFFTGDKNDHTYALIIANERYNAEANVKFAHNDGNVFAEYVEKTLGVPKGNITVYRDASINQMRRGIDWLKDAGRAYNGDIKVILYYAGHGLPDEATKDAYLIPADGVGNSLKTLFPLKEFYKELGEIESEYTVLFLDACFTGSKRDDEMLSMARGVKLRHNEETPARNLIVFSAAQSGETAWGYDKKDHGMFTYFLLKKLQDSKGNVTLGDLADYITNQVKQCSFNENNRSQNPTVSASPDMLDEWQRLKLK